MRRAAHKRGGLPGAFGALVVLVAVAFPAAGATTTTAAPSATTTTVVASPAPTIINKIETPSTPWTKTWLPVLFSGIVSAAIAVGVTTFTNTQAENRWRADTTRRKRDRDIDWVREATARCLEAAQNWRAALERAATLTADAVASANSNARRADELTTQLPDLVTHAEAAAAAKQKYIDEHRANLQTLDVAARQAENAVRQLQDTIADCRAESERCATAVEDILDDETKAAQHEWARARTLTDLLAPDLHSAIKPLQCSLTRLAEALDVPRESAEAAFDQVEIAIRTFLPEARSVVDLLRTDPPKT